MVVDAVVNFYRGRGGRAAGQKRTETTTRKVQQQSLGRHDDIISA